MFYGATAARLVLNAGISLYKCRLDVRTAKPMLEIAEASMAKVRVIIAAAGLTNVAVADARQNLADTQMIVTYRQQTDVHNTKVDRRHCLCRF